MQQTLYRQGKHYPFQMGVMPPLKLYVCSPDLIFLRLYSGNETQAISKSTGQPAVQDEAEAWKQQPLQRLMAQTSADREERNIFYWANQETVKVTLSHFPDCLKEWKLERGFTKRDKKRQGHDKYNTFCLGCLGYSIYDRQTEWVKYEPVPILTTITATTMHLCCAIFHLVIIFVTRIRLLDKKGFCTLALAVLLPLP